MHSDISKAICVKNSATAFFAMIEIAKKHIEELKDIWIEHANDHEYVPLSSIIGRSDIKKHDALLLEKVIKLLIDKGEIKKAQKENCLVFLIDYYLKSINAGRS